MATFQIFELTDIEIGQHCGSSAKPTVFQGNVKRTGDVVAVKNITNVQQRGLDILKRLQHDHVVRLRGIIHRDEEGSAKEFLGSTVLVLEYAPNGNLYEFLNTASEFLPHFQSWCKQAVCDVEYIHQQNISHRDIKSKNYLVFGDVIKLTDFGISKITNDITSTTHNIGGTILWMAPEVMDENDKIDYFRSDIYSLGIVLWELYHRTMPYDKWKLKDIIKHVLNYKGHLEIDDGCDIREVLLSCLEYEPTERPTAKEILTPFNNNGGTSIVKNSKSWRRRGLIGLIKPTKDRYFLILAFAIILLGLVINALDPIANNNVDTNKPIVDVQTEKIPTTQPATIPTENPTTQPATILTTASPPRDWQKEGYKQINNQNGARNRRGTVRVYDRDFGYHAREEWFKHYSTATDIATGIKADAGGYGSRGGANEHAIENLINKLMARNIITN
ncbi:mitogen-activated protein kinase kinase kinase 12-like [Anneissia japonica]|uniref:mitogen-activated protein kinase kinase kinase 12-like n=1 Tax=Anneissia japonica TaxID=1529436 RepID=UPI0014258140|nr:mitogen-activated protein kinase kinase kinase 12-like [Anneissia japonica]